MTESENRVQLWKLEKGQPVAAPLKVIYQNRKYKNPSETLLRTMGYKSRRDTEPPECPSEYHAESHWEENETEIFTVWEIVEDSDATKAARRRQWFDEDYRKWNEMFTRYEKMGISETIDDEFRGKTYHSLAELYAEGEIVRKEILELEGRDDDE